MGKTTVGFRIGYDAGLCRFVHLRRLLRCIAVTAFGDLRDRVDAFGERSETIASYVDGSIGAKPGTLPSPNPALRDT